MGSALGRLVCERACVVAARPHARLAFAAALSAIVAVLPAPAGADPGKPTIRVLSNRADLISGGDALVAVDVPKGANARDLRVMIGSRNVTSSFVVRRKNRSEGLVKGLRQGQNVLTASLSGGVESKVTITNHPNGGPVFSGPQIQPWVCQEGAVDKQCNQRAKFTYLYRSTNPTQRELQPYDHKNPPDDVAMTTTDQGVDVKFIVRVETGYQDRDQYKIAMLYQPGKPWTPWAPQKQWNHKLVVTHGSSCNISYGAGNAPSVTPAEGVAALERGFGVMSTALDHNGHNCNIATQAESLMMAKEHLIETYGTIRYTIATGCSGGSLTQQQVANAYLGIYQGLLPQCSFPDTWSSATHVMDYHLLRAYFELPQKWGPGDAITTDANKCMRKPLSRFEHMTFPLRFTESEWLRLMKVFATGICDYGRPAVGQQHTVPWQTYQDVNGKVIYGGKGLPSAPGVSGEGWTSPSFSSWRRPGT